MSSIRAAACITIALSAALTLNACSRSAGGALTPLEATDSTLKGTNVIYHQTYFRPDTSAMAAISSTSISYMGMVTTLPAIVSVPVDITYDPDDGNFYVLSQSGSSTNILRVSNSGATSSFASVPSQAAGITYDHATRKLYVTTILYPPAVYALNATGTATILAGGTANGHADGSGAAASFTYPTGITLDAKDNALYLADQDRIRRITATGVVTTFTPANSIGVATDSNFQQSGIVWSPYDSNFYVADSDAGVVRKITSSGAVSILAGQCLAYYLSPPPCTQLQRDGIGTNALFATPSGITVTPSNGSLYVADRNNNAVRRVLLNGSVSTLAGNGLQQDVDGAGQNAEFNTPVSLAYGANAVYVVESSYNNYKVRTVTVSGAAPPPLQTKVTLYDTKMAAAQPFAIDWHPSTPASTTLWYSEAGGRIASLTTSGVSTDYAVAPNNSFLQDLVLGSDGTPYVFDAVKGQLVRRTNAGSVVRYQLKNWACCFRPNWPDLVATAPNGNVWTATNTNRPSDLAYVTPQGAVTTLSLPSVYFAANAIAFAADGTLWMTDGYNTIYRLNSTGAVLNTYHYSAQFITRGIDGNIWFTQPDAIGRILTSGLVELFPLYQPVPDCSYSCSRGVGAITAGPDGAYWFTETNAGAIGRLDPNGGFTEYAIYSAHRHPFDIVPGPDGNVWFLDSGSQKIGKVQVH